MMLIAAPSALHTVTVPQHQHQHQHLHATSVAAQYTSLSGAAFVRTGSVQAGGVREEVEVGVEALDERARRGVVGMPPLGAQDGSEAEAEAGAGGELQEMVAASASASTQQVTMQLQVQVQTSSPELECERALAMQLAYLASQHNMSEYARFKHGMNGSPQPYVPLSLANPDMVRALQARQEVNTAQQAWWIAPRASPPPLHESTGSESSEDADSESPRTPDDEVAPAPPIAVANSTDIETQPVKIQQEVAEAIAAPLLPVPPHLKQSYVHPATKTSLTHPINISVLVPPDTLPAMASQLAAARRGAPVLFVLPESCFLDRIVAMQVQRKQPTAHVEPPVVTWNDPAGDMLLLSALSGEATFGRPPSCTIPSQAAAPPAAFQTQAPARQPTLVIPPPGPALYQHQHHHHHHHHQHHQHHHHHHQQFHQQQQQPPSTLAPLPPTPPRGHHGVIRHSPRHHARAASAPPLLPPALFARAGARRVQAARSIIRNRSAPEMGLPPAVLGVRPVDAGDVQMREADAAPLFQQPGSLGVYVPSQPLLSSRGRQAQGFGVTPTPDPLIIPGSRRLGNLLLSSCPGKKVRLDGPVRGRGAICRDLHADLRRVKELGVGCVICCLDDSELAFLGAPWPEYLRAANDLGLDVLRLPTPEGLAPLRPGTVAAQLVRVMREYTLRGVNVLAHCRGGVGRAGLVACCWMLLLGLCGWKDARTCTCASRSPVGEQVGVGEQAAAPSPAHVCPATLQLVERAIGVVRRRRSWKAVETYEQVRFLVAFVQHLQACGAPLL